MKIGQFVKIEYTGMLENGEIFDSTDPSKMEGAKGPIVVVLGAGHLIKGVEKELLKMGVGEEKEIEVEPKDGFGERDPKKIKLYPIKVFLKEKINPIPGLRVTIDGKLGTIVSVTSGRVVVDFNHPLAGRKLIYHLKILEEVKEPKEQIRGLLDFHFGQDVKFEIEGEKLKIYNVPKWAQERVRSEIATYTPFKNIEFLEEQGGGDGKHNQGGSEES